MTTIRCIHSAPIPLVFPIRFYFTFNAKYNNACYPQVLCRSTAAAR